MESSGGWRIAKRKKGRRSRKRTTVPLEHVEPAEQGAPSEDDLEKTIQWVSSARCEIQGSKMWAQFRELFSEVVLNRGLATPFDCTVIYGLGGLSSFVSRYQLGLVLELRDWLALGRIETFDPIFTERDKLVMQRLGVDVLGSNERGARVAKAPTLVYMAHCEADLHENLISANRQANSLHNLVMIGNDLYKYKELFDGGPKPQYPEPVTLLELCHQGRVISHPLEELDLMDTRAFNDTSLQIFRTS
ncbi:hypothetical protein BSKO_07604 [Bryopsis sp. KO-2023]|nr:hypothetical protein BSKO_07604 [Bryopsis sp. KO-2023]